MADIESFYWIHDLHPNATGYFPASPPTAVSDLCDLIGELVVKYLFLLTESWR